MRSGPFFLQHLQEAKFETGIGQLAEVALRRHANTVSPVLMAVAAAIEAAMRGRGPLRPRRRIHPSGCTVFGVDTWRSLRRASC
jgi:hypothetical protein